MKLYITIYLILLGACSFAQDSLRYYYNQGVTGYNNNDLTAYQDAFYAANRIRPYHPTIVFHLARANALLNEEEKTFETAKVMALMNGNLSVLEDSAFLEFKETPYVSELNKLIEKITATVQNSSTYISVKTNSLHPEAITAAGSDFYLGGVHDRKIVRIDKDGDVSDLIVYKSNKDLFAVMGLSYDSKNELLWACTAAIPEMLDFSEELKGKSSVFALDLKGNIVKSETIEGNHLFGDLVVNSEGTVFISDGIENSIYTVSLNSPLEKKINLSERTHNLQGLALNENESHLYIADYILGLYRIDLNTNQLSPIHLEGELVSKGFDGIYYYKNSLIAIQNGTNPDRLWRFYLNDTGNEVIRNEIIDQALQVYGEPTQGVIKNDKLFYIANSPWGLYKEGKFLVEDAPETIVLQTDLK